MMMAFLRSCRRDAHIPSFETFPCQPTGAVQLTAALLLLYKPTRKNRDTTMALFRHIRRLAVSLTLSNDVLSPALSRLAALVGPSSSAPKK